MSTFHALFIMANMMFLFPVLPDIFSLPGVQFSTLIFAFLPKGFEIFYSIFFVVGSVVLVLVWIINQLK